MSRPYIVFAIGWGVAMAARAAAQASPKAHATPAPRAVGTRFRDCPECPEMVVLPAGRFVMGSSDDEKA